MSTEVIMPTLGLTMEEGTITEWLKREGETVAKDEPLFVVETDKAAMEVPSPASGVLQKIIVPVGATAPVRAPIALIGEQGAAAEPAASAPAPASQPLQPRPAAPVVAQAPSPPPPAPAGPPAAGDRQKVSPRARLVARELGIELSAVRGSGPGGRVVELDIRAAAATVAPSAGPARVSASPLARKLATEHGIDLASVRGSGPGGRIVEKDIRAAAESRPAAPSEPPAAATGGVAPEPAAAAPAPAPAAAGTVPLNRLRRLTAERMAASARSVARVTLFMPVDMSEAVRFRSQLAPEFERRYGARLGYDAMLAKAAALALRDHAELNAQWADGAIRPLDDVNIGTAVALDDGLVVAVVRNVDRKPLHQVQAELRELVEKGRAGRLGPDDVSGSSFTITNLGGYGVEAFTPIVNLPEAGILGVGVIARQPAVVGNELAIREQMTLSLAFDHRVTDGVPAARFLQRLKEILEAPYILLT